MKYVVDERASIRELVQWTLGRSVQHLLNHTNALFGDGDGDAEAVHQARVATRRLRSDLRTFRPVLVPATVEELRAELRWLGDALGSVRDIDVLLLCLRRSADRLPESDQSVVAALLQKLDDERRGALTLLADAVASDRYLRLAGDLVAASRRPPLQSGSDGPAAEIAPALVARRWRQLRRLVKRLDPDPSDEELHAVRISVKRTRYAAEAVMPVVGTPARRLARHLASVQDILGEQHDAVVAERWLRKAARAASSEAALVAGQLVEIARTEAEHCRRGWRAAWHRAARPKNTRWLE